MREAAFTRAARATFGNLDSEDQAEVSRLISLIEHNPEVDNRRIFDLPRPPVILRVLDDGVWQIEFYVPDEATVVIRGIAHVSAP
jgi:hypothetical protein